MGRVRRNNQQLVLPRTGGWGGARANAGRKLAAGRRKPVPHRARGRHNGAHPVHVTMRVGSDVPKLRHPCLFFSVRKAIVDGPREDFRVAQFSVQADHIHFIVEGRDENSLARGIRALAIRIARAVNGGRGKQGRVFEERYHARPLRTPREVRFGLLYVLMNHKKHLGERISTLVDRCSSGIWFERWRETRALLSDGALPPPTTWLLRTGWLRAGGELSVFASPRPP